MKVLFLKNIKGVAQVGDIKDVSDGHARNYLIPRGLAKAAIGSVAKESETLKKKRELIDDQSKAAAEDIAKRLEGAVLEITEGANPEGHLYGSVDAKKIAHGLDNSLHIKINEDQIHLPHHLKTTGDHQIKLNLHTPRVATGQTIATTLTVRVLPS